MYQAKAARTGYEFYAQERDFNSRERLVLANDLAAAIELGALEVHYQPKAVTETREVIGAEALVRWRRADGTLLMPEQFITAAEHAGLIRSLTNAVLAIAVEQVAAWRAMGHQLHVAVNVTAADLLDVTFPDEVALLLGSHRVPASALALEVTRAR